MEQLEYNALPQNEQWRLHYLALMSAEMQTVSYLVNRERNFPGRKWAVSAEDAVYYNARKAASLAFEAYPELRDGQ